MTFLQHRKTNQEQEIVLEENKPMNDAENNGCKVTTVS